MRKNVGYFEGTDPVLLTNLICRGYDTVPVSNGFDSHGRHVRLINEESRYDLLVGYVHKVYAPDDALPHEPKFEDILHVCRTFSVPLLLLVPDEMQSTARSILGEPADIVHFADPGAALTAALEILED